MKVKRPFESDESLLENNIEKFVASTHVPYSMLLYERYLGGSFASHRDSVSELIGDLMENAIEKLLHEFKVLLYQCSYVWEEKHAKELLHVLV